MTWRTRLVAVGLTAWLTGGCRSRGASSVTPAQACADLAMALCNLRAACGRPQGTAGDGASVVQVYGDLPTCLAREALACANELSAPDTGNSATAVESCVHKFSGVSCADLFNQLPPSECAPLGLRGDGAGCAFDSQCASGFCKGTNQAVCGTCGAPPGVGKDCSASRCAPGDRCLAATSTCVPMAPFGGACSATRPCGHGLSCVARPHADAGSDAGGGPHADAGTDGSGHADGGTDAGADAGIDAGADAHPPVIQANVSSGADAGDDGGAPVARICQLSATVVGAGCGGALADCDTTRGLACAGDPGAMTCLAIDVVPAPVAPDGEACDTAAGPGCMPPARCVTDPGSTVGTCVIPQGSLCPAR